MMEGIYYFEKGVKENDGEEKKSRKGGIEKWREQKIQKKGKKNEEHRKMRSGKMMPKIFLQKKRHRKFTERLKNQEK